MVFVLVGILVVAATIVWFQGQGLRVAQYVFFLRYPLLFALALAAGPVVAVLAVPTLLGNLFVLDAPGLLIATGLAYFTSSSVVYAFNLVFALSPKRTKLGLFRTNAEDGTSALARHDALADELAPYHFRATVLLLAPLGLVLTLKSSEPWYRAAFLVFGGAGLGLIVSRFGAGRAIGLGLSLFDWVAGKLGTLHKRRGARSPLTRYLLHLFEDGFESEGDAGDRLQARATLFFVVSAALYVLGYWLLKVSFASPARTVADAIPPLAYVLILMMVWTWILSFLAYTLDKFRVPPFIVLGGVWAFSYTLASKDHYFEVSTPAHAATPQSSGDGATCALSPKQTVSAWLKQYEGRPRKPTLVIVAASGGGITASLWTARVLTALSAEGGDIGPEFARSLLLISSASGGGVGASYFVDRYREGRPPGSDLAELQGIVSAAGSSSLHDTAFALAYSDLIRAIAPALIDPKSPDRGRALEQSWGRFLSRPGVALSDWRAGVQAGWRPTQVFNVTIAETGERLLLSPIDCPTPACGGGWRGKSPQDLYGPGCDLPVVAAARLSATFPWVTPLSRAPDGLRGYHLGDGGYYDNFGVVTSIEWLFSVHATMELAHQVEKVLIVQVRAAPHVNPELEPGSEVDLARDQGWLYAAAGPLLTLLNVRTTSQRNHNEAHLSGMKALLNQQGVPLETVEFELGKETPLSWHLTPEEKASILSYWEKDPDVRKSRDKLVCLWKTEPLRWTEECKTDKPILLSDRSAGAQIYKQVEDKAAARVMKSLGLDTATAVAAAAPAPSASTAPLAVATAAPPATASARQVAVAAASGAPKATTTSQARPAAPARPERLAAPPAMDALK